MFCFPVCSFSLLPSVCFPLVFLTVLELYPTLLQKTAKGLEQLGLTARYPGYISTIEAHGVVYGRYIFHARSCNKPRPSRSSLSQRRPHQNVNIQTYFDRTLVVCFPRLISTRHILGCRDHFSTLAPRWSTRQMISRYGNHDYYWSLTPPASVLGYG